MTLSWNSVSGATYYEVGVTDMSTGSLVVDTTTTSASYAATLTAGKTYRWNVAACNAAGCSTYTAVLYFQTPATGTVTVNLTSPNGGGSVQAGASLPISWTVSGNTANISIFFVEYSLTGGAPWNLLTVLSETARNTSWSIPAGTASSQAKIQVRAFDAAGTQIGSDASDSIFTIVTGVSRPVARLDCNNNAPAPNETVTFYGSGSQASSGNPQPTIVSYAWNFGDSGTASGMTATHKYTTLGARTVTLTVTDSVGLTDTKTMTVNVTGQALGTPKTTAVSDDPVNLATGNFIYDHSDLTIPGIGFPFEFKRAYNSKDSRFTGAPLGHRWTHSYNLLLSTSNGAATIVFGDGHSETYTNSAGVYFAEAGIYNVLTTNVGGGFILTTKEQMKYNFNSQGRLASIVDKNGNTLSLTYDGAGALTVVTNSAGRVVTFVNDASHRITAIIDPLNRTNAFAYSAQGDLVSATDPRGGVTRYGYDADHQMTNAVDPNGNQFVRNVYSTNRLVEAQKDALGGTTTFTYDFGTRETVTTNALGYRIVHKHDDKLRVVQIIDEAGNRQNFEYDDFNNRTKVVDNNNRSTRYGYDAKGNVTNKIDALGNVTRIQYDSLNNPTNRTDAKNGRTAFFFDGKGNLIKTVNALKCTNTVTYESRGLPQLIRDANGNILSNSYDAAGNLVASRDALGYVRSNSYDGVGRKIQEVDPNGATNRFAYDPNNNLLTTIDPLGFTNSFAYDANNNQIAVTDARSYQTVKTYDAKDRLVSVRDPLGGVASNAYDALDRKIATTDPLGNVTRFAYDPVGNLVVVSNALGQATRYTYDANGNQLTVSNALGQVTTNQYNELNRLVRVTDPLGYATRYDYDELGQRTRVTDANSQITRFNYDALGRLTNVVDASTGKVSYVYDRVGNRISMTEPNGRVTTFSYDVINRLIQKQEPIGTYRFKYDGAGNRLETVDALGRTNRYAFDVNNRLRSITYPVGTPVTFTYDPNGNRTNMVDALGSSSYRYDALNRLTNCTDSAGMTVAYSYDANGNRISMTYPGNKVVNFMFDSLNRMVSVRDWLNGVATNTYDAAGNLVRIQYPNGTTAVYGYDAAGRLTRLTNALPNAAVIASYNLTLDGMGNHLSSAQVEPLQPLIPAQTVNYAYDIDNRLINATGTAFTYDANGNMLKQGADTFAYDFENRLTQAVVGGITQQYQYDGLGNRLGATRNGVTTKYVLDVNGSLSRVLAEADAAGTITAYYVYGRGLVSRISAGGTPSYYHYDVRGSTIALSDSSTNMTDKYAYDPFGTVANSQGTNANPFKYVGRYGVMNEGNGLAYIRARYYSPGLGRFVTKDPVTGKDGDGQSLNRYIYVLNNPVNWIDISGYSRRESSGMVSLSGTSDQAHSDLLEADRLARQARLARILQYQAEALRWEKKSIYWNAGADSLQGLYDALQTAGSLLTGNIPGVIGGLSHQFSTLFGIMGSDKIAQSFNYVGLAGDLVSAVNGVRATVNAGQTVQSALTAGGQNLFKDAGFNALLLDAGNPVASAYSDLVSPIIDLFGSRH